MTEEKKKCQSCRSFRAYYSRGYYCLLKENIGFCQRHSKVMEKSDSCNDWLCRKTDRNARKKMAIDAIIGVYGKLAVIEQIINEDNELIKIREEMDNIIK